MVSLEDSYSHHHRPSRFPLGTPSSSPSASRIHRHVGRSMRTIRSSVFLNTDSSCCSFDNLSESAIDMRLGELLTAHLRNDDRSSPKDSSVCDDSSNSISQVFSDFSSSCSSDISGELQRLACLDTNPRDRDHHRAAGCSSEQPESERESGFSSEIITEPEDLQICVDGLQSASLSVKRSAAEKLRLLAKNRSDNRALIGESGAIPALIPLLRCSDPWTQEHAVTALLNLSLHEQNKGLISDAGTVKSFVYVLKTGTETSKQNAACALLSLALVEENRTSIGSCGAIPPLVSLLMNGSTRGKKDALTTLYKLCSVRQNKERAVTAGAVSPLVGMVGEQRTTGTAEKAMVVLSSLAGIEEGKEAIVEEGGIAALVEAIEDGSCKGKEFAVLTLLQMCSGSVRNRGLLVREGGIPPLVALSQTGSARAKHKAETLLAYLREPRQQEASCSSH